MARQEFIRKDEALIIKEAVSYNGSENQIIAEVDCNRTWSIDEALEEVTDHDNCFAVYRAGPEGFEDISLELADHYIAKNDVIEQREIPASWLWFEGALDDLPFEAGYINPNAEHSTLNRVQQGVA